MELMVILGAFIVGGLFGIVLICTLMCFDDYDVARENFQTGKEIGYRKGYEEGYTEAWKEAKQEAKDVLQNIREGEKDG